jgi:hypothetical protein
MLRNLLNVVCRDMQEKFLSCQPFCLNKVNKGMGTNLNNVNCKQSYLIAMYVQSVDESSGITKHRTDHNMYS